MLIYFQNDSDKPHKEDDLDDSITYESIQEMAKTMGQGDRHHDMDVIMTLLQVKIYFLHFSYFMKVFL